MKDSIVSNKEHIAHLYTFNADIQPSKKLTMWLHCAFLDVTPRVFRKYPHRAVQYGRILHVFNNAPRVVIATHRAHTEAAREATLEVW